MNEKATISPSFDYNILVRILGDYATETDQQAFDVWVRIPANRQEFEDYRKLWEDSRKTAIKAPIDLEADWQKVAKKIRPKNKRSIRPFHIWVAGVAASILVVIVAFFIFNSQSSVHNVREIALADGTKVWLNRNAELDHPKVFDKDHRTVTLTGEAFFEVSADPKRPFIIRANQSEIRVLGTAFNVKTAPSLTEVTVENGKVQLAKLNDDSKPLLLEKAERGTADAYSLRKELNPNQNVNAWRTGDFVFNATRLDQVAFDLSTYYDKPFRLQGAACLLTATFEKEALNTVLDVIEHSCGVSIIERKGEIILTGI